jgi:serine/threonine protein kinase
MSEQFQSEFRNQSEEHSAEPFQGPFQGNARFSILRRLGAGGMGIVYEALDHERQTRVALKTLRNLDPASIYRFKIEFRSLAELSHENLLPLYELFFEDDRWFFTMELLEGATDLLTYVRGEHRNQDSSRSTASSETSAATQIDSNPDNSLTALLSTSYGPASGLFCEPTAFATFQRDETAMLSEATAVIALESLSSQPSFRLDEGAIESRSPQKENGLIASASHLLPSLDYDAIRRTFHTVAQGVRALHAAGKVHRDLKPENVMVRADGRPVLLDFGLILDLKPQAPTSVEEPRGERHYQASTDHQISGTLSYMAPEQATGSPLLNSSDWYAFGVMLFEALTGRLPFTGKGIEIVRAKIAQQAPRPSQFVSTTPPDLDQLCVQLLDRNPENRPSGAEILRCLSGQLSISNDNTQNFFVGRESYLNQLNSAFTELEQGHPQVLSVHGRSGMGKTTLLRRFLDETAVTRSAIVLEGRCYEQESVPYKAVDNLIDSLAQRLLEMSAERLRQILPANIQALARVFPVLNRVAAIGESTAETNTFAADNPLQIRQQAFDALGHLLAAIGATQPLLLSIDDLQWGDIDSALLLSSILAQQPSPRMLVLLSYRSEYSLNPCLREFRRAWESGSIPHQEIEVLPLSQTESRDLATQLLAGIPSAANQIDRIVEQARGSAFFVQELAENARSGMDWQANTSPNSPIKTSDLDEVLWRRAQQLPPEARQLLEIIAVAGQPIQIGDLIHTRSFATIPQNAVNLLRSSRLIRSTGARLTDEIEAFHDRVRESIANHLPRPIRRDYHQQIADALEANPDSAPETIASHLQAVLSPRAAHFYELAGERAIRVLAFDQAEGYLKLAAQLAPTTPDRARVEVRLVHFYTDTARFQDAYTIGCEAVARFGVKLPRKFSPPLLIANALSAYLRTGRRKPSELLNLPNMADERLIAVVGLIAAMAKAAYQVRPEICVSICALAVNLCLKHGNAPDAAVPYMVFGCIFLGGILGRAETGYEFGRLALALVEKFENHQQRAEVNFVVGYFGTSWMRPAIEAEQLWETAFIEGQRTGDLFHTGCAVSATIQGMLMRGAPLDEIDRRLHHFRPVVERAHLREPMTCLASTRQLLATLRANQFTTPPEDPQLLADLASFGSRHFAHFHFLNQSMLHALTGSTSAGLEAAARSATYLADAKGLLTTPEHYFWSAMLLAMHPASNRATLNATDKARKKFAHWVRHTPANFALRHELLCAESARLRNHPDQAAHHYERAIQFSTHYQTLHLLAFANHRAATLAASLGKHESAQHYFAAAQNTYIQWGAPALAPAARPSSHPTQPLPSGAHP